jgi:hypothetical protein
MFAASAYTLQCRPCNTYSGAIKFTKSSFIEPAESVCPELLTF